MLAVIPEITILAMLGGMFGIEAAVCLYCLPVGPLFPGSFYFIQVVLIRKVLLLKKKKKRGFVILLFFLLDAKLTFIHREKYTVYIYTYIYINIIFLQQN